MKPSFKTLLNFLSLVDQAKAVFQNLKKLFSKKKNELKKANKSGNSRETVGKAEQGFKALTILSWLDNHLQLRDTKSNFPKLNRVFSRSVFSRVHLQIIQMMATTDRRTRKRMVVKNALKLKKTRTIPLAHPISREKGKMGSSKSHKMSSNYHIYNPSRFEGPFRVDNDSYLQGTFRSTGNVLTKTRNDLKPPETT